jgi:hypothetical protein
MEIGEGIAVLGENFVLLGAVVQRTIRQGSHHGC